MAFRYEFRESAARDIERITRRNHSLLFALVREHLPKLLQDPFATSGAKKGDLAGLRAYNLTFRGTAYRLVFRIDDDVLHIVAFGPHDEAYRKASRR